ncbi:hypothetical protein CVT26_015793 [Gymnopilus dilepis]|uniref:Uncharacterized protein n=1 Tax=Gymnopilus dilepis TaxID=231916 RepID=A0A409W4D8_9AGAR|nr:hypothetical protein CVT26_015793 [Gymnopilus dilepis]
MTQVSNPQLTAQQSAGQASKSVHTEPYDADFGPLFDVVIDIASLLGLGHDHRIILPLTSVYHTVF